MYVLIINHSLAHNLRVVLHTQIIRAANETRNLPPHNPEATVAHEAYKFEEICPPPLWKDLPIEAFLQAASDSLVENSLAMEKVIELVLVSLNWYRCLLVLIILTLL